jgi:hypothetical protein
VKKLVLTVVAEHHRDIYNAMKSAIDLVDVDFTAASGSAPCFDFNFAIADLDDEMAGKFGIDLINRSNPCA